MAKEHSDIFKSSNMPLDSGDVMISSKFDVWYVVMIKILSDSNKESASILKTST